jgi:release factor glutamine methyltransferase
MENFEACEKLVAFLRSQNYQFTTITPLTQARVLSRYGVIPAVDLRAIFGWNRCFLPEALPRELFGTLDEAGLIQQVAGAWRSRARVSSYGSMLFVHSAFPTTEAASVFFGPDTLRFLAAIERHLDTNPTVQRAVDIGCGSGAGAIVAARRLQSAEILMIDINAQALQASVLNARLNKIENVLPLHANMLNGVDGLFDLIISNPPYLIDRERRAYRHGGGDFGEGLSLEIVNASLDRLSPTGVLLLYTGSTIVDGVDRFKTACSALIPQHHYSVCYEEVDPDVFGEELDVYPYTSAERIAAVVLKVRRRKA